MISRGRNNITGSCRSRGSSKGYAVRKCSFRSVGFFCTVYGTEKGNWEHFNASNLSQANATDILMSDQQNVIGKRTSRSETT